MVAHPWPPIGLLWHCLLWHLTLTPFHPNILEAGATDRNHVWFS